MYMNLKNLTDSEIISKTEFLVREERRLTLSILYYLREIERRQLFAERGFGSLHEYAVKALGYSDGAAARRIQSMRLLKDLPELESALSSAKVSLTTAAQLQNFIRVEERETKMPYTKEEKLSLLKQIENKSKIDVDRTLLAASVNPNVHIARRERVIAVGGSLTRREFVSDALLDAKLERLKSLLSHKNPEGGLAKLIDLISEIALEKLDPARKPVKAAPPAERLMGPALRQVLAPTAKKPTRYIRKADDWLVWTQAEVQCQFVDNVTKRRCTSKHQLEIEHIKPYALGGTNEVGNLKLLCRQHNLMMASQAYGRSKMQVYAKSLR